MSRVRADPAGPIALRARCSCVPGVPPRPGEPSRRGTSQAGVRRGEGGSCGDQTRSERRASAETPSPGAPSPLWLGEAIRSPSGSPAAGGCAETAALGRSVRGREGAAGAAARKRGGAARAAGPAPGVAGAASAGVGAALAARSGSWWPVLPSPLGRVCLCTYRGHTPVPVCLYEHRTSIAVLLDASPCKSLGFKKGSYLVQKAGSYSFETIRKGKCLGTQTVKSGSNQLLYLKLVSFSSETVRWKNVIVK